MITVPTRSELLRQGQALLSSLDSSLVVTRDSDAGIKLALIAEALFGVHYNLGRIQDDLFVSERTSTEALELHAAARLEGGRKGATAASGTDCLEVSGTDGSVVAIGDELVAADGTEYQLTSGGTVASGTVTVSAEATTTGIAGNRDSGEALTFVSPPAGIDATATLTADIDGGEDQETDGELVGRLLDAYRNPLGAGRLSDYRQWAQAVEGVLSAYSYGPTSNAQTGRRGLGIVDVAILKRGSGSSRIPSATVQGNVEDYIEDRRPACTREFGVMLPDALEQSVEVQIVPKAGYAFDWEKRAAVTVDSWTAGTRTLVVTDEAADFATAAGQPAAGDRVLITGYHAAPTAEWVNYLTTIVSIADNTPAGKCTLVLADDPDVDPASGDAFWPGGSLTQPCIHAVQALFDSLGPARGDAYDPEQDWNDSLFRAAIDAALMGVDGVANCTITTPATDVEPDDDAPSGGVELLIPGYLLLRPALTS
jgi:uncharacterized phage protein gp47/JayE